MGLQTGTRLGSFDIVGLLGVGGMGEVYRATDTKLGRTVAIKVLPEAVVADGDRVARFEREARVLASLNHPNIAALYGLEHADGRHLLVMELVEGETLADRIARGAIPIADALAIADQMADALEAAHERGVIHRDLKPANIKITPDDRVKVLDFGLAKAVDAASTSHTDIANSPTITSPAMTAMGTILGTAAYMAPEQARGKPIDRRADIWAFGTVLFEMLTGRRTFEGDDITLTMAAVVKDEPDWKALPPGLPRHVLAVLKRCLRKDPRQRMRDIGDVRLALAEAPETHDGVAIAGGTPSRPPNRNRTLLWLGAIVVAAVAGAFVGTLRAPVPVAPAQVSRTEIILATPGDLRTPPVVTPNGQSILYLERIGGISRIMRRDLKSLSTTPVPGGDGAGNVFPSADSRWLVFSDSIAGTLERLPIEGGSRTRLCEECRAREIHWATDGWIYFGTSAGISRVSAEGGKPEQVCSVSGGALGPRPVPGSRALLYYTPPAGASQEGTIFALPLDTCTPREIARGVQPQVVTSGHILFARRDNSLWAAPFDAASLSLTREASALGITTAYSPRSQVAEMTVSDNGVLVYQPSVAHGEMLVWVNQQGSESRAFSDPNRYAFPRLSSNDRRVALMTGEDISVLDLDRGTTTPLTNGDRVLRGTTSVGANPAPILTWNLDDSRVFFSATSRDRGAPSGAIAVAAADGDRPWEDLFRSEGAMSVPVGVIPDGRLMYVQNLALRLMRPGTPLGPETIRAGLKAASVSPDGRWVAFVPAESERDEVFVARAAPNSQRHQVSNAGGTEPTWSRDGRQLYYRQGNAMTAVAFNPGRTDVPELGTPRRLFDGIYKRDASAAGAYPYYDVARDGRFLMVRPSAAADETVVVVQNWFEELKQLVPLR